MEANFNHEQSLSLISEMIERARNNVQKKAGNSLIYWGYVVAALAVVNYVLLHTLDDILQSFFIWLAMIPAGLVSYFMERRIVRETLVKTHIDKINATVWQGFLVSFVVFTVVINLLVVRLDMQEILMLNIPVMLTLLGMGIFISACVIRYKVWYALAAITWAGAIVSVLVKLEMQFIVFALCMVIGIAVPGHTLNCQAKKNHV